MTHSRVVKIGPTTAPYCALLAPPSTGPLVEGDTDVPHPKTSVCIRLSVIANRRTTQDPNSPLQDDLPKVWRVPGPGPDLSGAGSVLGRVLALVPKLPRKKPPTSAF